MKHLALLSFFLFIVLTLTAQGTKPGPLHGDRLKVDPAEAPFYHGVASGDPLSDAVVIWTRVTTDSATVDVSWEMALDTGMTNVVQSGVVTTDASKDYTVKVDVTGLDPYTTYYYDFKAYGNYSVRGRTKTAPVGMVDSLRFAVFSCASFENGYYNAYRQAAERNDFDAFIHLGDYIYEYADGEFGFVRSLEPVNEIVSLNDYRMRHSHYKLDPDLQIIHQQYPVMSTWDDHEIANNAWFGGAENHNPGDGEGDWFLRKSAAIKGYFEWMPLRKPDPTDDERIYRKFSYGDLAEIYVLDTRIEGRTEQVGDNDDPNKKILGDEQFNWLIESMDTSSAQWNVVAQQVFMAPLQFFGLPINGDAWDGYQVERSNLWNEIDIREIKNTVVLTGDIHSAWASDLPLDNYDENTGANSAGVEFVATSVTSPGVPLGFGEGLIQVFNPHIKYADLNDRGYFILDLNQERVQADYFQVDVQNPGEDDSYDQSWQSIDSTQHLTTASGPAIAPTTTLTILAPPDPRPSEVTTSTFEQPVNVVFMGAYPNPFRDVITLQFYVKQAESFDMMLVNAAGQVVYAESLGTLPVGLWKAPFELSDLPAGLYFAILKGRSGIYQKQLIKID